MITHCLLYILCCVSLSYAYYQSAADNFNITIGPDPMVFRLGQDIYTITKNIDNDNFVSKFGVDQNNNFYGQKNETPSLGKCLFCHAFALSDTSVFISTGYDSSSIHNDTNMGISNYNPARNDGSQILKNYTGSPQRRIMHQVVMTPDNSSIYIFGGALPDADLKEDGGIYQYDLKNFTYTNHGPAPCMEQYCGGDYTVIGGTATMLPSGIVVLAFGSKAFNFFFHATDSVYLYDTNANSMTMQNVTGTKPEARLLSTGVLGASLDIYNTTDYFGVFDIDRSRAQVIPGVVVLNTSSWTWIYPNITGPPNVDRISAFSMLYVNNSILIGGGTTPFGDRNDISILRNLPLPGQTFDDVKPEWFTNSEFDAQYKSAINDNTSLGLSTSAIVGIVIGIVAFIFVAVFLLWKTSSHVRNGLYIARHKLLWNPRPGEPFWAEFVRVVSRIILFFVFLAFLVYIILRALSSPIINQVETDVVEDIKVPDIRICSKSLPNESSNAINIICGFSNGTDCSPLFQTFVGDSRYLSFDGGNTYSYCVHFLAPDDLVFHDDSKSPKYMSSNLMTIKANQVYKTINSFPFSSFYITYYAPGYNPNRVYYNVSAEGTKLTEEDVINWKKSEESAYVLSNTYSVDLFSYTTIGYTFTQSNKLTNDSWNNIGFSYKYDTKLDVSQDIGPSVKAFNATQDYKSVLFEIIVAPTVFQINITKEQKVSTIVSGLAQAGGVLSLIIAIQVLMFGFRPNSPWGLIHHWSFGSSRKSLSDQLANQFDSPKSAVPFITPVHSRFSDTYEEISRTSSEAALLNPEKTKDFNDSERLKIVEERLQLMELLFKSYYINDEIFYELDKARRRQETEPVSTKINEEIPLSQLVRRRTNSGDTV